MARDLNEFLREVILPQFIADILDVEIPDTDPGPNPPPTNPTFEGRLRAFVGQIVTIETSNGDSYTGRLRFVGNGVVIIEEPQTLSPFTPDTTTFIRLNDIVSFSVDNDN